LRKTWTQLRDNELATTFRDGKARISFFIGGLEMKLSLSTRGWIVVTSLVWRIAESICHPVRAIERGIQQKPIQNVLEPLDPSFAAALKSMYAWQPQMGTDGSMHILDGITKISPEGGMWIYELCRKIKPKRTLEIGLAYGFSTMYFLAAIKANAMGSHVAMDPFQITLWHGIGLKKAQEMGMDRSLRFIQEKDVFGLPALAREGLQFEVIFIDGNHRFDNVLLDFTLSDYVCVKGGYIILDDLWMPSIRKAVSFIESNRSDYQRQDTPIASIRVFKKLDDDRRQWYHFVRF
jgi:predicted O-methyltransferase YrrM